MHGCCSLLVPVLLGSVVALCYPSSEVFWIVGKVLLLLVLLHNVSEEKLAELATTTTSEVITPEPVTRRVLEEHPRAAVALAALAVRALDISDRSQSR